jgi:hypothetical protein
MTTALDIITGALLDLGIGQQGQVPDGAQADHGLKLLNDLLQSLSNERLMINTEAGVDLTLTGASSYTWGLTGDINLAPCQKVTGATFKLNNIDYFVDVITQPEYDNIPMKTLNGGSVSLVYVNYSYPSSLFNTVYVWPQSTVGTLNLNYWSSLTSLASLTTAVVLPSGYERMLRLCLAVELMPSYGMPNQMIIEMAIEAKASIKRINQRTQVLTTTTPISGNMNNTGTYRIRRGF